jgi:hypothetical protein
MDSLDPSKNKILFKKRIHRPWKSAITESNNIPFENTPPTLEQKQLASPMPIEEGTQSMENHSLHDLHTQKNRITIGGFLSPKSVLLSNSEEEFPSSEILNELKNKEQEILLLSHDLKVTHTLEQLEKLELAHKKEEEARKAAEEKALYAIHQAKIVAEKIYKTEQQLTIEKQCRIKEEKLRQFLEGKVQLALQQVEEKDQLILKEKQDKLDVEEKMKQALDHAANTEKRVLEEAETKISKQAEEKIKQIYAQTEEKINFIQSGTNKKIQDAQERAHFHEKAKLAAQAWTKKYIEIARRTKDSKQGVEKKLDLSAQKINGLLEKINHFDEQKAVIISEKYLLEEQLAKAFDNIKKMQAIISTEKELRKILEEKLNHSHVRQNEQIRKFAEDKILALARQVGDLEVEKSKVEGKLLETNENLLKLEILMDSEKTIRNALENNIKGSAEKVNQLEYKKQKESELRHLAEQKIAVLLNQNGLLEQEKKQNAEKYHQAVEQIKELKIMLESERYLRKEAERLKLLEEQTKQAAEQKIRCAIEQANKTVLTVLGSFSTPDSAKHDT